MIKLVTLFLILATVFNLGASARLGQPKAISLSDELVRSFVFSFICLFICLFVGMRYIHSVVPSRVCSMTSFWMIVSPSCPLADTWSLFACILDVCRYMMGYSLDYPIRPKTKVDDNTPEITNRRNHRRSSCSLCHLSGGSCRDCATSRFRLWCMDLVQVHVQAVSRFLHYPEYCECIIRTAPYSAFGCSIVVCKCLCRRDGWRRICNRS